MPYLIKQFHQIKATPLQVRLAKDDGVVVTKIATQTLNHVWGSLELILHILQIPTLRQSDGRSIPYEHLKDSAVEEQSNSIAGVAFNLIPVKQIQLRINMA